MKDRPSLEAVNKLINSIKTKGDDTRILEHHIMYLLTEYSSCDHGDERKEMGEALLKIGGKIWVRAVVPTHDASKALVLQRNYDFMY